MAGAYLQPVAELFEIGKALLRIKHRLLQRHMAAVGSVTARDAGADLCDLAFFQRKDVTQKAQPARMVLAVHAAQTLLQ